MSVYDWPDEFKVRNYELAISPNLRSFAGTYSPTTDVTDLLGEAFMLRVTLLPEQDLIRVAAREAFFDRLRGPSNQFRMGHAKMRAPNGTLRGLPVLSANVAQLSNGLTLNNCTNKNLLLNSSFEVDTNADGLANGWVVYTAGSVTGGTPNGLVAGNGSPFAQRMLATVLGSSSSDQYGLQYATDIAITPGANYSFSVDVRSSSGGSATVRIVVVLLTAALAVVSSAPDNAPTQVAWGRRTVSFLVPPTAVFARAYVWMQADTVGAGIFIDVDNAQFEQSATSTPYAGPPTLLAGDMVSVNDQMVRVMASTVANDAGVMPVEFGPRARVAWTAGMAAVWNRPTALFRLVSNTAPVTRNPGGFADAMSFEALEYI